MKVRFFKFQFSFDMLNSTPNVFTAVSITKTKLKFLGAKRNFKYCFPHI